jgi:hypothetical protein
MTDKNGKIISVGKSVNVPDPNDIDIQLHAFTGTVADLFPQKGTVIVEDQDSDFYEIEAGRLETVVP